MLGCHLLVVVVAAGLAACSGEVIDLKMTEVFVLPIIPSMFEWNSTGKPDDFVYRPSLANAPDLPSWVHYTYSHRHASGFLYGVPPNEPGEVQLEVIGMNRQNYKTGRMFMDVEIEKRKNPASREVQLKIDNLNLEDLFDPRNQTKLMDVFRLHLWNESKHDLYFTFLASAIDLGARLPLRSTEGEGVVIRLGSRAEFSEALRLLQQEVAPLRSLIPCPRDFKRTTVERVFRDRHFEVDWCSFRLIPPPSDGMGSGMVRPTQQHRQQHNNNHNHVEPSYQPVQIRDNVWYTLTRDEVPQRSYMKEFALTILLPMLVMLIMVLLLSLILCFHHEGMRDASSEYFDSLFDPVEHYVRSRLHQETGPVQMVQYSCVHRASDALRTLSSRREPSPRPASMATNATSTGGFGTGADPGATFPRTSTPRRSEERTPLNRPEPPPYAGSQRNGNARRMNYTSQ